MLLNDICSSCSKIISKFASLKRIEIETVDVVDQVNSNTGENTSSQSINNPQKVDCIVCDGGSSSITKQCKQKIGSYVDSESQTPLIWNPSCDHQYTSKMFTFNESSSINPMPNYLANSCSSPIDQSTLPVVSEQDLDEVFSILNDEPTLNETRTDSDPIGSLESIYDNLCEYLFDSTHLENSSVNADSEQLNIKSTPYDRPASSNENCLSPMVSNPDSNDSESSYCAVNRSFNLDPTPATDGKNKQSQSNDSNNDDKENKKRKCSFESSSSDEISLDPYLKLIPKVHLLRLPNFIVDSNESASSLDQVYSSLTESLFARNVKCVYRYQPKYNDDEQAPATKESFSGHQQTIEDIADDYDDEDTVEMDINSSDYCVILSSDDEVIETSTVKKPEPFSSNERLNKVRSRPLRNHKSKNEKNTKILFYYELQRATKKAIELERKRLRRRVQRKKLHDSLFPNLTKNVSKKRLIFDIDINKSSVRVEVRKQLAKMMKLYQLDGIKPR